MTIPDKYRCLDFMGMSRWQVRVIPVGTFRDGSWWITSRVTHTLGGNICLLQSYEPVEGWDAHWLSYRQQHPELERYWKKRE